MNTLLFSLYGCTLVLSHRYAAAMKCNWKYVCYKWYYNQEHIRHLYQIWSQDGIDIVYWSILKMQNDTPHRRCTLLPIDVLNITTWFNIGFDIRTCTLAFSSIFGYFKSKFRCAIAFTNICCITSAMCIWRATTDCQCTLCEQCGHYNCFVFVNLLCCLLHLQQKPVSASQRAVLPHTVGVNCCPSEHVVGLFWAFSSGCCGERHTRSATQWLL
jgi:hypothetical protein